MVSAAAITLNTVSCAVPVTAFLYFFTVLGSGVATFEWSERHDAYGNPLLGAALALPMVIYVCDGFNHWQRTSLLLAKRAVWGITLDDAANSQRDQSRRFPGRRAIL